MNESDKKIWDEYFLGVARPLIGCKQVISWQGEYYNDSPVWYIDQRKIVRESDNIWYIVTDFETSYILPKPNNVSPLCPFQIIRHPTAQTLFNELQFLTQYYEKPDQRIIDFFMNILPLPEELVFYILTYLRNVEIEILLGI